MEITVQFEAQLRQVAGVGQASVNLPDGTNVEDALRAVAARFGPALGERLIAAGGTSQRSVLLFVNDKPIAYAAVAERRLNAGDVLLLYPPISGG